MTRFTSADQLFSELASALSRAKHESGGEVGIICFQNHYASILSQALATIGCTAHLIAPIIEGIPTVEGAIPIRVSLKEARDKGMDTGQFSLMNAIMRYVSDTVDMYQIAVPCEPRVVLIGEEWKVITSNEPGLFDLEPELMLAYLQHDLIQDLVANRILGKKSNRSSDWKIWNTWFQLDAVRFEDCRMALKPLWDHYHGELYFANERHIQKTIQPYHEAVEELKSEISGT